VHKAAVKAHALDGGAHCRVLNMLHRRLQGTQRPALAIQGAVVLPDTGRKGSEQAADGSDDQAARRTGQRPEDGVKPGAGGTIDLNNVSSSDEDVALVQPAAPHRSKLAFTKVMVPPSCTCLFSGCCRKTLLPRRMRKCISRLPSSSA